MVSKMTKKEKLCIDYAERFKKNWEYYILVADAFSAGQKSMKEEILSSLRLEQKVYNDAGSGMSAGYLENSIHVANQTGLEIVEVEHKDGEHQIGHKSV